MKRKVVFLADCLITQRAGIHYYTKQFIKRTIEAYPSYDYYMVVPSHYEGIDIQQIIIPINKKIPFHLRIRNIWQIPNRLNKLNPDVIIEMAHFGPFRLKSSIKRVTVIHDLTPILYPAWHDRMSTLIHKLFLRRILTNADHIIANSHVTASDIAEYHPPTRSKIQVVYPSVEIAYTKNNTDIINDAYFLSVGTLEPRKNYESLIRAFDVVAQKNDSIKLIIIGFKGWKSDPIFKLIDQSSAKDRIIIKGYVSEDELIEYYAQALAFVFPTHYEGFGLPLLEAMTLGTLVVCSDIDICHEVCGDGAVYFGGDSALISSMEEIIESPESYSHYRERGLLRAKKINDSVIDLANILS